MTRPLALVVDDEPDIRELVALTLERMEIDTHTAADLDSARQLLGEHAFDLCLTDMRLPDGSGRDLVRHIQQGPAQIPVAVITAHGNMESAVEALKSGAFDFVSKPVDLQILRKLVSTALRLGHRQNERDGNQPTLLGDSPAMRSVRTTIAKLARSQAPVYISGESGTGKELVARLIHAQGPRADRPFVPVNCGAIPSELMESEFFGHRKGSFTGATTDKEGLFQAAEGGTLFLDEVADLPLPMQVKLLRAIQEKAIRPVGSHQEIRTDVRVLSATHKDLAELVREGTFRQDLFYRINVIQLHVPALRERVEDIQRLADHMLDRFAEITGLPHPELSDDALDALNGYAFPGNVRELENILERAMTLCDANIIHADDLQLPENSPLAPITAEEVPADFAELGDRVDDIERQTIVKALEQTRYNKTAAARLLGLTFRQLRYRLKKLNIE